MSKTQRVIVFLGFLCIFIGLFGKFEESDKYAEDDKPVIIDLAEKECLKSILWYESRDQSELGIKAVLSVVENRKNHPAYPETYCKIMLQKRQFSYVHQNQRKGKPLEAPTRHDNELDRGKYRLIDDLATEAVSGSFQSLLPSNVLHYTTTSVKNHWTRKKKVYTVIDDHKFYISDKGI